ncbi:hypothetical protein BMS3Abin03_02410 [bacterium BMS3Abin03]|nr:hypothetical protein BMS3Abin03_02410 [bacterium BMS3Abin03]
MINVPILFSDFHSPSNAYGYACGGSGLILQYIDSSYVPVELMYFKGEALDHQIKLSWSTATEKNNYGFEVHRLNNNNNTWQKIGFIPGQGTTAEQHKYSFVDETIKPGIYHYRLKQVDYNGIYEYSKIIGVEIAVPTKFSLEQNYPNPFNPTTKIKFSIAKSPLLGGDGRGGLVTLKVYDILGSEVATLVNEEKSAGTYEVEFDASNLPSGIYFYRLESGSFSSTKKLILLK